MNAKVKSFFKNKQSMAQCLSALQKFIEWKQEQLSDKQHAQMSKSSRIQINDNNLDKKMLNKIQDEATQYASKLIINQLRSVFHCKYEVQYSLTDRDNITLTSTNGSYLVQTKNHCTCAEFSQLMLPCKHIFYVRNMLLMPLYESEMLINRYVSFFFYYFFFLL